MTPKRARVRYDYFVRKSTEETRVRAICDSLEFDIAEADEEGGGDERKLCFDESFRVSGKEVRVWVWQRGLEAPRNI